MNEVPNEPRKRGPQAARGVTDLASSLLGFGGDVGRSGGHGSSEATEVSENGRRGMRL